MKTEVESVDDLLARLGTNQFTIETTIEGIACFLKATSRTNEIIGLEYAELAVKLRESQTKFKDAELTVDASNADSMRKYLTGLGFGLPPSFVPSEQMLSVLGEAAVSVRIASERVERAYEVFRSVYPKTRPAIKRKAGRTKHKWDNLEQKKHQKDFAAVYIDSVLRGGHVDTGDVARYGAKLMYQLGYSKLNPKAEADRAIRNFRRNVHRGAAFFCELGILINSEYLFDKYL